MVLVELGKSNSTRTGNNFCVHHYIYSSLWKPVGLEKSASKGGIVCYYGRKNLIEIIGLFQRYIIGMLCEYIFCW